MKGQQVVEVNGQRVVVDLHRDHVWVSLGDRAQAEGVARHAHTRRFGHEPNYFAEVPGRVPYLAAGCVSISHSRASCQHQDSMPANDDSARAALVFAGRPGEEGGGAMSESDRES